MTKGAMRILKELAANNEADLVREGLTTYCGKLRTTSRIVNELLWCMAIKSLHGDGLMHERGPTYFQITSIGRSIVRRPELEMEIQLHVRCRKGAFEVKNDRIVLI